MSNMNREWANPARLNKRLEIIKECSENNGTGGSSTKSIEWKTVATVWAQIEPQKGATGFNNNQWQVEMSHIIYMRYRKGITRENRLRYQGREFKIENIINVDEQDRFLEISAIEEV